MAAASKVDFLTKDDDKVEYGQDNDQIVENMKSKSSNVAFYFLLTYLRM